MKGQTPAGKMRKSWDLEILVETSELESGVVLFNYFHAVTQILLSFKLSSYYKCHSKNIAAKDYLALLLFNQLRTGIQLCKWFILCFGRELIK